LIYYSASSNAERQKKKNMHEKNTDK